MSYVEMEKKLCPICGKTYDSGSILLHKQLKDIPEEARLTGYQACAECDKLTQEGYIALVEIDPARSKVSSYPKMEDVYRTGRVMHIRRSAAERVFTGVDTSVPMMWIDSECWNKLVAMMPTTQEHQEESSNG